jgi:hypothetical protein
MRIEDLTLKTKKRMISNTVIWTSVISYISSWVFITFATRRPPHWIVFIGLVCLIFALANVGILDRDTHLPFLGVSYVPPTLLKDHWHNVDADIKINIDVCDRAKGIVYWSALPHTTVQDTPMDGYGDFSNAGFSRAENGIAIARIKCPGRYIARGKTLPKHIHWREVFANGLLGPVKKKDVVC